MFKIIQLENQFDISNGENIQFEVYPTGGNMTMLKSIMCDLAIMIKGNNGEALLAYKRLKDELSARNIFSVRTGRFRFDESDDNFNAKALMQYKKIVKKTKDISDREREENERLIQSMMNGNYGKHGMGVNPVTGQPQSTNGWMSVPVSPPTGAPHTSNKDESMQEIFLQYVFESTLGNKGDNDVQAD